ncbi:MAG: ABC transporter permease [Thermoanaerobaculia bacterium]
MRAILAICWREFRAFFFSPLAYILATLFLAINGFIFWLIVSYLSNPLAPAGAPMQLFFGQTVFFWLVLLFITPILTMRSLAEERRSGTLESLLTAPVTEGQIVTGKFCGVLAAYLFLWLPTLVYSAIVARYGELDWGPVTAGYVGVVGIGALWLSIGIFASALSRSQMVAALVGFAVLVLLFSAGLIGNLINTPKLQDVFDYLDLWQHMGDFGKGIVDTRPLVYYLSGTILFLFLASRALETRKWR